METSIGILETKGFAVAIAAADKILEDNNIDLFKIEKTGGGIVSLFFKGNSERLKAAFGMGIQQARLVGEIVAVHISNQPNKIIEKLLSAGDKAGKVTSLKNETVVEKIAAKKVEVKVEKTKEQKPIKTVRNLPVVEEKIKVVKPAETTSTIQRLRQEALSPANISKEKETQSKLRDGKMSSQINMSKIENLNVHELRHLARSTNGFPIQGREISRAIRKELINYFKDLT
jgi:microcompartment protein CcmL/EutN